MKDDHTKIEITKTDITGEQEIEGAKLQVLDEEGNIIEEWTSTKRTLPDRVSTAGKNIYPS